MNEAGRFAEEVNIMKELIVEQLVSNEILNIDEKSLKAIQSAIRISDAYIDLTLKQAREIEELNKKLDNLTRKMDKLMSK